MSSGRLTMTDGVVVPVADVAADDVCWYCPNDECGNCWQLPAGETPGPCSGCRSEMEIGE